MSARKSRKRIVEETECIEEEVILDVTQRMIRDIPELVSTFVKTNIQHNASDIKSKIEHKTLEIKHTIEANRIAETHVAKKNCDQSIMLARLNAELREKNQNIEKLMTQISELKKENGRYQGRSENVELLVDIPERISKIEKALKKLQKQMKELISLHHGME